MENTKKNSTVARSSERERLKANHTNRSSYKITKKNVQETGSNETTKDPEKTAKLQQ